MIIIQEIDGQTEQEKKYLTRLEEEDFSSQGTLGKVRGYLWNLTEYPETSVAARVLIIITIHLF